ncbi:hypothetical protein B0T17DRAFT_655826 [Bombardia bombarda]|uniref:Uncharacterized protein n=1 Tax=Bombardia bombarda TaxID=252184 RepID=A0AA40C1Y8_9PEZI|nr:hypothetical protein B0T17DRAFT_655826 [Bombardia bombarda]
MTTLLSTASSGKAPLHATHLFRLPPSDGTKDAYGNTSVDNHGIDAAAAAGRAICIAQSILERWDVWFGIANQEGLVETSAMVGDGAIVRTVPFPTTDRWERRRRLLLSDMLDQVNEDLGTDVRPHEVRTLSAALDDMRQIHPVHLVGVRMTAPPFAPK